MTSRSHTIRLRVSDRERDQIEAATKTAGLTMSEYIRRAILRDAVEEADVGGGHLPDKAQSDEAETSAESAADVSPEITAKEWDREVKRLYHRGLSTSRAKASVTRQYGPRPKEEE